MELATQSGLLWSEGLTVKARALAGREAGGAIGGHWSEATGRQRLAEVLERMLATGEASEGREALEAALSVGE